MGKGFKMKKQILILLNIFWATLFFMSCESEYSGLVKNELASGQINNELFFGLEIGDTQKDFFETCWRLNKEEKISHGPENKYAMFMTNLDTTAEKSQEVEMLFYAMFDSLLNIRGMDLKFRYPSWAPWNTDYSSEILAKNLTDYYFKIYGGNPFLEVETDAIEYKIYVKVDGNRQIKIYPISEQNVSVKIEDLRSLKAYQKLIK